MTEIMIGIQARSTSARFPNKHMELLGGRMIMEHVLASCIRAAYYSNQSYEKLGLHTRVVLLIPTGDPLSKAFADKVEVFEGPEDDVLTRYKLAADHYKPDYICRITGDCPLIPEYVISKHLIIAFKNKYDYVSNVDPSVRTAEDGIDCEVMSRQMLDWLDEKARSPYLREHVTCLATEAMPKWAKMGMVVGYFDRSDIKFSVDTMLDLERARIELARVEGKRIAAEKRYGKGKVHRL